MQDFYKVSELKNNVYRITSTEHVYMELLVGSEKALLIDTGHGFGDLRGTVKNITDKPLIIVNTHGHLDHASGNFRFDETVLISESDFDLCKAHTSNKARTNAVKGAEQAKDPRTGESVRGLPDGFDLNAYADGGTGKLAALKDGDVFDLGGITVKAVATPGHTRGSICLFYVEEKWLYVGDQANAYCWLFLDESTDRDTHVASLDKLIALNPVKVFGSHMPEPVDIETLKLYRRTAVEADFEKGLPFDSPFGNDMGARVCPVDGKTMEDFSKPGFASVVITKKWS